MKERMDYSAASPGLMKALNGLQHFVDHSSLQGSLLELVRIRASQINGCAYCIDMHSRDLLEGGLPVEHLCLVPVWREAGDLFSARERAALAWTETVTRVAETEVPDADFQAVSAHFEGQELADLTLGIALMNAYNRLGVSFRMTPAAVKPR